MTLIWGMTPEARTVRAKMPPKPARASTPSCIRAPPPSLRPMTGTPADSARSIALCTLAANISPSDPPKTRASCAKTTTVRPSTVPQPVTTPSPAGRVRSMPNPWARWRTNMSISTKLPGSSRKSIRSRAVRLPRAW